MLFLIGSLRRRLSSRYKKDKQERKELQERKDKNKSSFYTIIHSFPVPVQLKTLSSVFPKRL